MRLPQVREEFGANNVAVTTCHASVVTIQIGDRNNSPDMVIGSSNIDQGEACVRRKGSLVQTPAISSRTDKT